MDDVLDECNPQSSRPRPNVFVPSGRRSTPRHPRRSFLPPHAGGAPASRHVGSPIEMIHTPSAAGVVVGGSSPPPPAPAPQVIGSLFIGVFFWGRVVDG